MLRSLGFWTLWSWWVVVICDPLVLSAARSRSGRWTSGGDRAQRWWCGGSGWSGQRLGGSGWNWWGSAAEERVSPARIGRVHRALALEPSVDSDLGRAAERTSGHACGPVAARTQAA